VPPKPTFYAHPTSGVESHWNSVMGLVLIKQESRAVAKKLDCAIQRVFACTDCHLHSLHKSRCECETI